MLQCVFVLVGQWQIFKYSSIVCKRGLKVEHGDGREEREYAWTSIRLTVAAMSGYTVLVRRSATISTIVISTLIVLIGILRFALVSNVGVESALPIGPVRHYLCPAVGQGHPVFSPHLVTVAGLFPVVVRSRVLIFDLVSEFVRFGLKRKNIKNDQYRGLYAIFWVFNHII